MNRLDATLAALNRNDVHLCGAAGTIFIDIIMLYRFSSMEVNSTMLLTTPII
eukprot:SAG31_NODE_556_length_14161_cov_3.384943_3_plen_52_part_00